MDNLPKSGMLLIDHDNARRAFFNTVLAKNGMVNLWTVADLQSAIDLLETLPEDSLQLLLVDMDLVTGSGSINLVQHLAQHPKTISAELVVIADELPKECDILIKECGVRHTFPKQVGVKKILEATEFLIDEEKKNRVVKKNISEIQTAVSEKDVHKLASILKDKPQIKEYLSGNPEQFYLLAEMELVNNNPKNAEQMITEFLKLGKHNSTTNLRALSTLGKALCAQKKFEEAMQIFKKVSEQSPLNLMHHLLAGETELELGNISESQERFEKVLEIDSDNAEAKVGLAKVDLATGDIEAAFLRLASVRKSVESLSLASYFNNVGITLIHKDQFGEAIKFYQRSLTFFSKYKYVLFFNIGMAYLRFGELSMARENFSLTIRSSKEFSKTKVLLCDFQELSEEDFAAKYDVEKEK